MAVELSDEANKLRPAIFLSNLSHDSTKDLIAGLFATEDIDVDSVQIVKKGALMKERSSGAAVVLLNNADDVQKACKLLDGKVLNGRPTIVRANKFETDDPNYVPQAVKPAANGEEL